MTKPYPTLPQRLLDAVERFASPRAQMHRVGGKWENISASEMLRDIAGLSAAFNKLGVASGDRVAIFAPNCPEWHVADFATLGLGAVCVPIYFRESAERIQYIINHSEAKCLFVAGEEQVAKIAQIGAGLPSAKHVIVAGHPVELRADLLQYESLVASAGPAEVDAYRHRAAALDSSQLASIIYTSGTTGEPKGVMLSHANFVSNELASLKNLPCGPEDISIS